MGVLKKKKSIHMGAYNVCAGSRDKEMFKDLYRE